MKIQQKMTMDRQQTTSSHPTSTPIRPVLDGHKLRRSYQVGGTTGLTLHLVEGDLTTLRVDALVNAANATSFTPLDGGVSGALRRACQPDQVTGLKKTWWDSDGKEHRTVKLPGTQAGVHATAGKLRARGVLYIIHAFGPMWTDYAQGDRAFKKVCPRIRRTVVRALDAAERTQCKSCALPAISGGIFTHWSATDKAIKEREQEAARQAVVEAALTWVLRRSKRSGSSTKGGTENKSSLRTIFLCDLPRKKLGSIHLFVRAWDQVMKTEAKSASASSSAPLRLCTSSASPTTNIDSISTECTDVVDHHDHSKTTPLFSESESG